MSNAEALALTRYEENGRWDDEHIVIKVKGVIKIFTPVKEER